MSSYNSFGKTKYLKNYPQGKKRDTNFKQSDGFASASKHLFDIISSDDRIKSTGEYMENKND